MRAIICGGRSFLDHEFVRLTLESLSPTAIAEGGASGADAGARIWARRSKVPCTTFLPDWKQFGRSAGPIRNQQMIDEFKPDVIVAFHGGRGTADMIRRAEAQGIAVHKAFLAFRAMVDPNLSRDEVERLDKLGILAKLGARTVEMLRGQMRIYEEIPDRWTCDAPNARGDASRHGGAMPHPPPDESADIP